MAGGKEEQIFYNVGINDLYICLMTTKETATTQPVYDEKVWQLSNVSKLGVKGNGKTTDKYASNKLFARVSQETQHELTLDHVGLPVALFDKMRGLTGDKGVAFTTTEAKELPFFGLGFVAPLSNGEQNAIWYPRVQISIATEESYETTTEDLDVKDVSLTMTASGLLNNNVLKSDFNSTRTSTSSLTLEQFMKQVVYDESQLATIGAALSVKGDK